MNWLIAKLLFFPTHWANIVLSRCLRVRNWWDRVDDTLILGARPTEKDAFKLKEIGITGVVNTCAEYEGPTSVYRSCDIEQLHIPTIDFTHPTLEDVESAIEFIGRHAKAGGQVYVHCKAGRARSATIAICWMMKNQKLNKESAQELLSKARHQVNPRLYKRPVVVEFESRLNPN